MIPTILDKLTGETVEGFDADAFWWAEGNGGCDCNRGLQFDRGDEWDPECGNERYLITAFRLTEKDKPEDGYRHTLEYLNRLYKTEGKEAP